MTKLVAIEIDSKWKWIATDWGGVLLIITALCDVWIIEMILRGLC